MSAADFFNYDFRVQHFFSDGVYAKQMRLEKGYTALSHKHVYPHLSILASGVVEVKVNDEKTIYSAPACIEIKAGVHHEITALEDVIWYCIHATEEKDPAKVDEITIVRSN